ncbi:MAG: DUF1311 domain-containing protein, partial [Verrucomicrobiaceae bacterium]|nr:DUF1311 domain-containing protein [Verrucomicrobiaceae bacterium]
MSVARISRLGFAIVWLVSALVATAEEKTPTLAEAKAAYAKADRALNEAWAAAKKALSESEFAELQIKQRAWVKFRESGARGENREAGEKEEARDATYFEAAARITQTRVEWLRGRTTNASESLTGVWIDSYGGVVE